MFVDQLPVLLHVEVFDPDVSELVLRWYVVDANLALFDQLPDVEEPQVRVLCASTAGPIADDDEGAFVVNVQRCGLKFCLESQLRHHNRAEHDLPSLLAPCHQLYLHY